MLVLPGLSHLDGVFEAVEATFPYVMGTEAAHNPAQSNHPLPSFCF